MPTTYDVAAPETPAPLRPAPRTPTPASHQLPTRESATLGGYCRAALISGLLVALIGIVEMTAWHLHWTAALRIRSDFTPMIYNSALGLAVTGAAVATAVRGPSRWLRVAGLFDLALGGASLTQFAFGWELRIDQLLAHAYLDSPGEHPGRMAVNTALCLVLIGAAFLIWRPDGKRWRSAAMTAAGSGVASIAVVALFGHVTRLSHAYDWRQLVPMSLPTAVSMTLLAACLLLLAFATRAQQNSPLSEWVAVPAGGTALAITAILWWVFVDMDQSTTLSASEASRAVLFLGSLTGGMLVLMTWLAQHANRGRQEAEALTTQLREEMGRRELAEITLRDSQLLLGELLGAVPVGLFICDLEGRPYFANQVATGLLGRGADPSVTVDNAAEVYQMFVAGTDRPYPAEQLPVLRAAAGESAHVDDVEVHRPDGVFPLEIWGAPLSDETGEVRFGLSAFVDISQRRAAEQSLVRHAALLDLAHDVIYIRDAQRRITYWNHGAEVTYGWLREEAVGQVAYALLRTEFPIPIEDIEAVVRRDGQWNGELVQCTKSGERTIVSSRFVAEYNSDGTLAAIMAINTDITARKSAEAGLARHAVELGVLNMELTRSNDELEQFAYIASHDLSEPLRAISGPISLLAHRYHGELDPDADRFIDFAVDGCERMQTLINDLLAFSRIGRLDLDAADVDTNDVVDATLEAINVAVDESHAHVSHDDLPTVSASATQLGQLFQNLISNAIKFATPDVDPRVHISAQQLDDHWRFALTDNGIGVPVEHRERIFGMFKRLHTRTAYPGTGIGLAVCKKIVERHHGTIGIDDGPNGIGSTFWFTLPRREIEDQ